MSLWYDNGPAFVPKRVSGLPAGVKLTPWQPRKAPPHRRGMAGLGETFYGYEPRARRVAQVLRGLGDCVDDGTCTVDASAVGSNIPFGPTIQEAFGQSTVPAAIVKAVTGGGASKPAAPVAPLATHTMLGGVSLTTWLVAGGIGAALLLLKGRK